METVKKMPDTGSAQYTILIVDDAPVNLGVLSDYLQDHGFEILVARSGENALKRVQYVQPDIILLDVMMPGIDGFETCERLKANELTKNIPIIFMTALSETEAKVKAFDIGAVDYVTKPLQQAEVLARVTTHLKIRDLTHNLQEQNMRLQRMTKLLSKRALELEVSYELAQQVTTSLELDQLLHDVVRLIQAKFGHYFVGVWLLSESRDTLILQAGAGRGFSATQIKEALGYAIPRGSSRGIPAWVCQTGHAYSTDNVNLDSKYLPLTILPLAQAELALPLQVGTVSLEFKFEALGVLDIYVDHSVTFSLEDRNIMQALANQIAIAIRNARFFQTEKKLRQAEGERAQELAELSASKDKFFSILAHDLKSPFLPLLGWLDLLTDIVESGNTEKVKEVVGITRHTAHNIYNLLENLLSWSKLQMKRMEYQPKRVSVKEAIDLDMILLQPVAFKKGIYLSNRVSEGVKVQADENMFHTVIRNLVSNAIKFTAQGGQVTLEADSNSVDEHGKQWVQILITDNGVGMSAADLAQLFRLDIHHTTLGTAQEKGTGLGLIMCKEMVAQHGGQIQVQSELNRGTVVKFTLPAL